MKRDRILRICAMVSALLFLIFYFWDPFAGISDKVACSIWKSTLHRALGGLAFLFILLFLQFGVWKRPHREWISVLLPAFAVAINNAPIRGLLNGDVVIERKDLLFAYVLEVLAIGFFEEVAFRGVLFPFFLEGRRKNRRQIVSVTVITSALFGLLHLINLAEGAGFGATLLQVGYSFLIGGMCAVVYLKTGNVVCCVLIHAVYDFGGNLTSRIASGNLWDTETVILTAVLGTVVFVWMLYLLFRVTPEDLQFLFDKEDKKHEYGEG